MITTFSNYDEWRSAITGPCGLALDRAFCEERLAALADEAIPSTRSFVKAYGTDYRDQVVEWFTRAAAEA